MKARRVIITTVSFIAIFGLIGCTNEANEKPSATIPPYISNGENPTPIKEIRELPKGVEAAFGDSGVSVGFAVVADKDGNMFIFKGREIKTSNLEFPIATSKIIDIKPATFFTFEGSKCFGISLGGSGGIGCNHIN